MNTIFTFEKLFRAYKQCLKHKKNTANALKFEIDREKNLSKLLYELQTGKYRISRHICFVVTRPAPREIFAADFRDRIVHHLLCNELQQIFERQFSNNSYANRKNFGTHKAVKKLQWNVSRGGVDGKTLYYLKMDIKNFFRSIDKNILWRLVKNKIEIEDRSMSWKNEVSWLARMIIFHNPTDNYIFKGKIATKKLIPTEKSLLYGDRSKGLPIGNLTSQFFANVYMNELDWFVLNNLWTDRYFRYVDDFILLDENKEKIKLCAKQISVFCHNSLSLKICPTKTVLRDVCQGVDFLGYFVKPTHTIIRQKVIKRFKIKFSKIIDSETGFVDTRNLPTIKSYFGHFSHASSYNLCLKYGLILD